ncbi:unnamed protein product [Amoebophrya sp. A25]|nr:unnamed protein product [Amoebophrya sp. A25]|eukprot:GSA25T00008179001.1
MGLRGIAARVKGSSKWRLLARKRFFLIFCLTHRIPSIIFLLLAHDAATNIALPDPAYAAPTEVALPDEDAGREEGSPKIIDSDDTGGASYGAVVGASSEV